MLLRAMKPYSTDLPCCMLPGKANQRLVLCKQLLLCCQVVEPSGSSTQFCVKPASFMESGVSAFQCTVINQNTHIICCYLSKKSVEMECPQFEIAVIHLTVISDIINSHITCCSSPFPACIGICAFNI